MFLMSNVKKIREKQTESSCFNILQLKNVLHKLEILKCVKLKKSKPKKKQKKLNGRNLRLVTSTH